MTCTLMLCLQGYIALKPRLPADGGDNQDSPSMASNQREYTDFTPVLLAQHEADGQEFQHLDSFDGEQFA